MSRILIVYGSTYGHTERTAQRIGSATSDGRVDDGQAANRDRERVRATPDGPVDCAGASIGGRRRTSVVSSQIRSAGLA